MKKILIGTTNPSKVRRFSTLLEGYDVELCTLNDLGITTEPNETGTTPKENAIIKAAYYGKFFDKVICNDSGLFFDALPLDDKRQPALNVRSPQGVRLNDEEMIAYYSQLIHSLGGKCSAYYMDGFAVCNQGKISSFMEYDPAIAFYMVERSNGRWGAGWPLDSLSIDKRTGLYFTDEQITAVKDEKDAVIQGEYREKVVSFLVESLKL